VLRILHCPDVVGGQAPSISRYERSFGHHSRVISYTDSVFGYPSDEVLWRIRSTHGQQEKQRWKLLARAVADYDVIHFNFGTPILDWDNYLNAGPGKRMRLYRLYNRINSLLELPLLRFVNKVIAVSYQGDDARQGDFCRRHFGISIANDVGDDYYNQESDLKKRDRIKRFSKHAHLIYALNPDLLHVLPARARFLPYGHIDLDQWSLPHTPGRSRPLLLHAPSHRGAKGTRYILQAVERLKTAGLQFDFILVEGITQAEARKLYEQADIAVDQLLAGWYGGFAVEMMALGTPVICYIRQDDLRFIPETMRRSLPVIQAHPGTIESVLAEWLTKPASDRRHHGLTSRQFVEIWHDPKRIVQRLLQDYTRARHRLQASDLRGDF
jgi:hypothetical protein